MAQMPAYFRPEWIGSDTISAEEFEDELGFAGQIFAVNKINSHDKSFLNYLMRCMNQGDLPTCKGWETMNDRWISSSTKHAKLCIGFHFIDYMHRGYLTEQDFIAVSHAIHISLVSIGISMPIFDFKQFGKTLFAALANGNNSISPGEYIKNIDKHSRFVKSMGFWQVYATSTHPTEIINCYSSNATPLYLRKSLEEDIQSNTDEILCLMCGIELLASLFLPHKEPNRKKQRPLECDYVSREIELPQVNSDQRTEQTNIIREYAPDVFQFLRSLVGIQPCDYIQSLGITSFMGNFLFGNLALYSRAKSSGKSGSSFYTTWDERYLLKSIPDREANSLRRILPQLCSYFEHTPNTLLNRIYGMYEYDQQTFVVLENVLDVPVSIHRIYDLKGSTQGRTNQTGEGILKDLDLKTNLQFGENRERILQQIKDDTQFLESVGLIDYSLMVGVHDIQGKGREGKSVVQFTNSVKYIPFHRTDSGGIVATNCAQIYFVGIIDYLTMYTLRKRTETIAKRFFLTASQQSDISCVPPDEYAYRFREFMQSICD